MVLKVFLGMEIGRYDGYEFMTVLKTLPNGFKLCWFDHDTDDEDETWDELWVVEPNTRFGWYGYDSLPVRTHICDDWKLNR